MNQNQKYRGSLTREQFLFFEIRIAAKFYLRGVPVKDAIRCISAENLFQYPTEREVASLTRACYKRLDALDNHELVSELSYAPARIAKQINLYAIMRYNRLVWDFMIQVIGEKYDHLDLSLSDGDFNAFLTRLQAQNDTVAGWSESTLRKIKSVLRRMLIETEFLDDSRSTRLNPVFLHQELEDGIRANGDLEALSAFNRL